jgi:broad specificity phosphatase PhoE
MEIYIARHGQNEDNVQGILNGHRDRPLTELGREQARESAVNIIEHNLNFDVVLTSPLLRAHETADIIAGVADTPVPQVHPLLIERDFGIMAGRLASEIKDLCSPEIIETDTITYFLSPEGAETFPVLLKRAKVLLEELRVRYSEETLLLVTHGDMGKMIYAAYYGLPWEQVLKQFHFGNSELLHLSPTSPPEEAHLFRIEQHNH